MDSYLSSVAARSNPRTARFLFSSSGNSPSGRHFTLMNLLCITLHGAVYSKLLEKARKKYIKIYNKDSDFKQTYYISVITKITSYLEMSYKKINIKQELKQLKQEYKYELQNINKNKINIYQKLMLKNIEKEKIAGIKILITLHKIYLKI